MTRNRAAIVIDTNVMLVAIPPQSAYRPIFDRLLDRAYDLVVSNDILTEYEEIIGRRYDKRIVKELFDLFVVLPNVRKVHPHFKWNLIPNDPDDNKFVDAAICANAQWIVTNDRHFNVLGHIDFPKLSICRAEQFLSFRFDPD